MIELAHGDEFELKISPVVKEIGDATVRMLAYNGSIPGPTLRVKEDSEIVVDVVNEGDMENTVHWHGLRLENRYDGTHETQTPVPVAGGFRARVSFPDAGAYWYHPHIREDYGQRSASTATSSSSPRTPTIGLRCIAKSRSPSTTSCSRTERLRTSAAPRPPIQRWAALAT